MLLGRLDSREGEVDSGQGQGQGQGGLTAHVDSLVLGGAERFIKDLGTTVPALEGFIT